MLDNDELISKILSCRKYIDDALHYSAGTHLFDDVAECILSGEMQLWCGKRSAAVTEIIRFPRKKVLHCFLAAGQLEEILDMQESAKDFGRHNGCTEFTIAGRQGWSKVLSKHGWTHKVTTMGITL